MHVAGGNEIEFLFDWSDHDCIVKRPLKFDFYIPDLGILIEYDGIQHYVSSVIFGVIKAFKKLQEYDSIKNKWDDENGFKMVRIRYDHDKNKIIDDKVMNY